MSEHTREQLLDDVCDIHLRVIDKLDMKNKLLTVEIEKFKGQRDMAVEYVKELLSVLDRFEETPDEDSASSCFYNARICGDTFWIPINRSRAAIAEIEGGE